MYKKAQLLTLVFFLSVFAAAQDPAESPKPPSEDAAKLRKEAVVFLRETLGDVNGMRSLENRISFTSEIASLMWFHDEREARAMYAAVIGDFRDLLARYDAQINALGGPPEEGEARYGFNPFLAEPSERARVARRFQTAIGVGQQIAMSLAQHDPELGYAFYYDSIAAISNVEFRKQAETSSQHFEVQLLGQIAVSNAAKATALAARSVAKGVTYQHVELLKKIYAKDPERGSEFALALFGRLKIEKIDSSDYYIAGRLLEFGDETLTASRKSGGKKAVYTMAKLRDLAEFIAVSVLGMGDTAVAGLSSLELIQKYAPGRAAQMRAKFKRALGTSNFNTGAYAINTSANVVAYGDPVGYSNSNSNTGRYERQAREREEREKAEREFMNDVQTFGTKELPKEERQKFVAQSRKIIAQTPGKDKKLMALTMLAAQVAKLGDKELASEIMRDAESIVNPAPKNYHDFLLTWMLASGYAAADPDKAFPLLEETIGRANQTLDAFVKVAEFIDVAEEMVQDGEVQVGAFGGQMITGLTRELGIADATIQVLAKADFAKTRNLTNRFDRLEIRVLAKMMVLRAILSPKQEPKPEDLIDGMPILPTEN